MMWYMHESSGWWMLFGGLFMVFFWGGLIALVAWGISRFTRHNPPASRTRPLDIARERYARGDISRDEFEQIRKDL